MTGVDPKQLSMLPLRALFPGASHAKIVFRGLHPHVLLNRGYNGYVFERNNRRIIFSGDTALSDSFAELRASGPIDLAIMSIGAYNPWIHSPCTREQAVQMANEAGAHFIMPVHLAITFCRCMKIPARYCTGARGGSAHHAPISQFWPSLVSYLTASA
jgi:L-ascorbate metabolism protein UlaG (beta-lactamase superfamily)